MCRTYTENRFMTTLPPDAEALEIQGYFAHAEVIESGWSRYYTPPERFVRFSLWHEGRYRWNRHDVADVTLADSAQWSQYTHESEMASRIKLHAHDNVNANGA